MSGNGSDENMYALNGEINGPVYAAALSVMLVLAFIPNLFIIVYTLCHPKILKQPSMIFLTFLALINLLSVTLYIPFTIITAAAGAWIIGKTDEQRDGMCQFIGFIITYTGGMSIHMLAVISFDRFLFIVKPLVYRQYMKPWVAGLMVAAVSLYVALQDIVPFLGLGAYSFLPPFASCIVNWIDHPEFVAYFSVVRIIPVIVMVVTILWTFCFTHNFIRKEKNHRKLTIRKIDFDQHRKQNSIYTRQVRNLVGIFGALMIVTVISFGPYITVSMVGFIVGFPNIPDPVWPTILVLFYINSIGTPIVQIYFRSDLQEGISSGAKKAKSLFCNSTANEKDGRHKAETSSTTTKGHTPSDDFQSTSTDGITA